MDVKDVAGNSQLLDSLRQIQESVESTSQRTGELVQNHPPPKDLVSDFMMMMLVASNRTAPGDKIHVSHVPPPYPPCVLPTTELRPLAISDMRVETHHRGMRTLLRVLTPPWRLTSIMAVVEDEDGMAVTLQLFFQPEESVVPANRYMKPHGVCIVKEPFFRCAMERAYMLRVDHPGDIIWLDGADDRIPPRWRIPDLKSTLNRTSNDMRMLANEAVMSKSWAEARDLYSSAIQIAQTKEDEQLAYLNRSLCNLKLGHPEQALSDALHIDASAPNSEKALFRQARALYTMRDYVSCHQKLQVLCETHSDNGAAKSEIPRVKARLQEEQTGQYAFNRMYKQADKTPPLVDCATFSAPVEVRASPGRGYGLFTKRPVVAGELLVCEKAFAYSYVDEDTPVSVLVNVGTKKITPGVHCHLLVQLMRKLHHSTDAFRLYNELDNGNCIRPQTLVCDGSPVVDLFLVEQAMVLNCFSASRTSHASVINGFFGGPDTNAEDKTRYATCGIWLLASRINHSCVQNCERSFIGDMQIVRATKDLEADSELLVAYRTPQHAESYDNVQKDLERCSFRCKCELCLIKRATPGAALERRRALLNELERFLPVSCPSTILQVRQLIGQIEETYPASKANNTMRMELWLPYFALGTKFADEGKPEDVIKMMVKALEALGFNIVAYPPIGHGNVPRLEVITWGNPYQGTPWAFLAMFRAYKSLAPELCPVVERYLAISYSIVVGEADTLKETFPELM